MASIKERVSERVEEIRERRPFVDHVVRMVQHYGEVKGNLQAGAVTYFAFLSFFPILALAFFVVGYVANVYPEAKENLTDAISEVLPGMLGEGPGKISLESIQDSAGAVGLIGLLGVVYAGLGWLSGMREALLVMFEKPPGEKPNFVVGKLKDLVSLVLIGVVMVVSVAVSSVISSFSEQLLDLVGLGSELSPLLKLVTVAVGLAANMLLFYALFRLLADPVTPHRSLWAGALLGAIGFEILKRLSAFLIASTKSQPAFQAFGIALILVVWINYFSRVVMYAAAWAHTSREARAIREEAELAAAIEEGTVEGPGVGPGVVPASGVGTAGARGGTAPPGAPPGAHAAQRPSAVAGVALAGGIVAAGLAAGRVIFRRR